MLYLKQVQLILNIMQELLKKLSKSKFRAKFKLKDRDKDYVKQNGLDTIRLHAEDFIAKRIAPAYIPNDGKQTPMKNHPVFIAQHATATCCRKCISKWHGFSTGIELDKAQQKYLVNIIIMWIEAQ